jgi:PAS domain S-box-containing protein
MNQNERAPVDRPSLREKAEAQLKTRPATPHPTRLPEVVHELQVHQAELELQNQELRRSQSELEASHSRYFSLFHLAPVPYFIFDARHHIVDLNLAAAELVGLERARLKNQLFVTFVPSPFRDVFQEHLAEVFRENRPLQTDCCVHHREHGTRWVRFHSHQLPSEPSGSPLCLSAGIDFTETRAAQEALKHGEAELAAIYDSAPIMMCLVNEQGEIERMNRAMADFSQVSLSGVRIPEPLADRVTSPGELIGCFNAFSSPQGCGQGLECDQCAIRLAVSETFKTGAPFRQVEANLRLLRSGVWRQTRVQASTALLRTEGVSRVLVSLEDVSGRKQLEAQLLQAQKMEAIGQLAGGVAHDFNNILAAMMMNLAFLRASLRPGPEAISILQELEKGAERAATLTRQLLLFGRRQMMQRKQLDLNEVVFGMLKMLRRLLGEHVEIIWKGSSDAVWVEGDIGMLEQVVLNLCVNARDAMPKGGHLTITTEIRAVGEREAQKFPDGRCGSFICLSVKDTGTGMDEATLRRIFEPFFTTKQMGKGTGLGLATVYGIVRQHRGWIDVESKLEVGTTFRVFLPGSRPNLEPITSAMPELSREGNETILVAEDDETVRNVIHLSLQRLGYTVISAANGLEALKKWEQYGGVMDVLLADMVMPGGMTGLELAERLRSLKPRLKVIISSGYSLELVHPGGELDRSIRFLPKPYQPEALAKMIREMLGEWPRTH